MGHLLGYARVSTAEQDAALQRDALAAAGCMRVWTDVASGSRDDWPQLGLLLEQMLPGDTLVVWRLDRLGRSLWHLMDTVTALDGRGVGFRSLRESIDTTTSGGRLVFHLFGALAGFERDLIRDRTLAGLDAARQRGRRGGRPPAMTPAKVRQAERMYADGRPVSEIAAVLGVGRATVYCALSGRADGREPDAVAAPDGQPRVAAPPRELPRRPSCRPCTVGSQVVIAGTSPATPRR